MVVLQAIPVVALYPLYEVQPGGKFCAVPVHGTPVVVLKAVPVPQPGGSELLITVSHFTPVSGL